MESAMKIITHEVTGGLIDARFEEELFRILEKAGQSKKVTIAKADDELVTLLNEWNGSDPLVYKVTGQFNDSSKIRFLISEGGAEKFKSYCLKEAPHAEWGCCLSELIAIEYAPTKNKLITQLHETLHLLGVNDCYDPTSKEGKPECNEADCIMRYGKNSITICSNALSQISVCATEIHS